ncbi:hypothetical protein EIJ81_00660 (plasmid) [Aliivibrio salmonicida]|uniref:PRTRC system protein C n=1 Tax=Aliivibrio salmonicida TaxID=40269 RepID=UPI000F6B9466|nr:PRTRC system protein C [Aliivibrio salmonicida]AZL83410.1 hypothetical protein EIJ81_00660 [Aliivibrio salmonicida]
MSLDQLPRKFKIGALTLSDPSPMLSVEEVKRIHSQQYPQVRMTTMYLEDGEIIEIAGEQVMLFTYVLPPISTNG